MHLVAVNGRRWTPDILRAAIHATKDSQEPIELLLENADYYRVLSVDYHGGERYPHLTAAGGVDVLSEIAKRHAQAVEK
jgi:hypothetical protein